VAVRLGTALREARQAVALSQADVAERAGMSQPFISHLERGRGTAASIETWSCVAAAVGEQYVGFLERAPGAGRPRDLEHLRRQSALVEIARTGGWTALPELAIDPGSARSRSIDVALVRRVRGEAVVAEIWDWFDDVGAGMRTLDAKRVTLATRLAVEPRPPTGIWRVRGLYVVRDTRRNRALVGSSGRSSQQGSPARRRAGSPRSEIPNARSPTRTASYGATRAEPRCGRAGSDSGADEPTRDGRAGLMSPRVRTTGLTSRPRSGAQG
jgi:transcriptional regulator with XRE-family HTH domain